MDNINIILASNILKYRKKSGLSQEELANKLGVTFQAVSKWENAKAAPDIAFLPIMADIFRCYIDELFSREVKTEIDVDHRPEISWEDDDVIRGVVFEGRKVLQSVILADRFTFEIIGDAKSVKSECRIEVNGNVSGYCVSGCDITVSGYVSGDCTSGGDIICSGGISGDVNCGGDIICSGGISGDVNCGGDANVKGDVEAVRIMGDVVCNSLKCDNIEGNVIINKID